MPVGSIDEESIDHADPQIEGCGVTPPRMAQTVGGVPSRHCGAEQQVVQMRTERLPTGSSQSGIRAR